MGQLKAAPDISLIDLLYFRPTNATCTAFDQALFDVAAAYRGRVRLVVKHSDERGYLFGGWISGTCPTVLLVRDGVVLAQLVGAIPAREVDALVCSSLRSALSSAGDEAVHRRPRRLAHRS